MEQLNKIEGQEKGGFSNTENSLECRSVEEAREMFTRGSRSLLDISNWENICGSGSADFKLTDDEGNEVQRPAHVADHIMIDIPGPGPKAGKGYDWVKIEKIDHEANEQEDVERLIITVRPATNPTTPDDSIAHFFSSDATSNFILRREGKKLYAAVLGRNEVSNVEESSGVDKVRNSVVGAGAIAGAAKLQWSKLVKGILQ